MTASPVPTFTTTLENRAPTLKPLDNCLPSYASLAKALEQTQKWSSPSDRSFFESLEERITKMPKELEKCLTAGANILRVPFKEFTDGLAKTEDLEGMDLFQLAERVEQLKTGTLKLESQVAEQVKKACQAMETSEKAIRKDLDAYRQKREIERLHREFDALFTEMRLYCGATDYGERSFNEVVAEMERVCADLTRLQGYCSYHVPARQLD